MNTYPISYDSERVAHNHLREAINTLVSLGASIRMIIKGDHKRKGLITICLSGEMSLRLQAMLAFGCPDTSVIDITEQDSIDNEKYYLPIFCFAHAMLGMMNYMAQEHPVKESYEFDADLFKLEEDVFEEDLFISDEKTKDNSAYSSMSIEDLGLSIRAYNCLRRADIHTVEDLLNTSDEDLMRVRNLGKKRYEEVKTKLAKIQIPSVQSEKAASTYSEMLDELIGLENVKAQIRKITAFARMKQDMESSNQKAEPIVLNMEFIGNPGTAKTTVARIVAGILYENGLLNSNELIEVGRADLIAKYEGQTADKVKNVFRQSKGKLLFIDEAYSLVENRKGEYGDEAINTIVQEMENNRKDTVVIFAGYPNQMKEFFSRNPGLRSRVPFTISFPDYSIEEMVSITELEAEKRGFSVSFQAKEKIAHICESAIHDSENGNGRFCRNLVENAILNYAYRVYNADSNTPEKDYVLIEDDYIVSKEPYTAAKTYPMGFIA